MSLRILCKYLLTPGVDLNDAASAANVVYNTAARYRDILNERKLGWADLEPLSDQALDRLLNTGRNAQRQKFAEPDWQTVHEESGRKGITVSMLYNEYAEQFGENIMSEREFRRRLDSYENSIQFSMRQAHPPGERMCVDFAGDRPRIFNAGLGEFEAVELFVSSTGVSQMIYAEGVRSQQIEDWVGAHVNALTYYGCSPTFFVHDNLKAGVVRVDMRNGSVINPSYQQMADYYGVIPLPTRPRRPKDKASVENAVRYVQRCVRAMLRKKTYYSLQEFNTDLRAVCDQINDKPVRHFENRSRRTIFQLRDVPAMSALPAQAYEYAEWRSGIRVPRDYHVEFEKNYYSVPHAYARKKVELRARQEAIEIYESGRIIATHRRRRGLREIVTNDDHQTASHRAYAESGHSEFRRWSEGVGEGTAAYVEEHLKRSTGAAATNAYRGLKVLQRRFGSSRLENACKRALALGAISTTHVNAMLIRGLENEPLTEEEENNPIPCHDNVRGPADYDDSESESESMSGEGISAEEPA